MMHPAIQSTYEIYYDDDSLPEAVIAELNEMSRHMPETSHYHFRREVDYLYPKLYEFLQQNQVHECIIQL